MQDELMNNLRPSFPDKSEETVQKLPELSENEIDAVLIFLNTFMESQVISFRIRKENNEYHFSVVDEFSSSYFLSCDHGTEMPTQLEVFELLITMKEDDETESSVIEDIIQMNEFATIDEVIDFMEFDSYLYPDLNTFFRKYLEENFERILNDPLNCNS